jgi:hypothetical protein
VPLHSGPEALIVSDVHRKTMWRVLSPQ